MAAFLLIAAYTDSPLTGALGCCFVLQQLLSLIVSGRQLYLCKEHPYLLIFVLSAHLRELETALILLLLVLSSCCGLEKVKLPLQYKHFFFSCALIYVL